jgi:hypothetical protein
LAELCSCPSVLWKIALVSNEIVFQGLGMAQVVECLPSMHKVLSSNSSTLKKNKKQKWDIKGNILAKC